MITLLMLLDSEEERALFTALYERYRHFLWYIANGILHDESLAEDAVQEAFLTLTRHMDQVEGADSTRTRNFCAAITRTRALDILRSRSRHPQVSLDDNPEVYEEAQQAPDVLDEVLERLDGARIADALAALPDHYREVFTYRYLFEMSEKETAEILGLSEKNVNARLFRARKKLQEALRDVREEER